jgi:hypothetical protein
MKLFKKILFVPSLMLVLLGCDPLDEIGPQLCPSDNFDFASNDLKIDVISKVSGNFVFSPAASVCSTVNLDGEGLHIHAKLSETVKWELEIKLEDGSVSKLYANESDTISIYWYGNGDKKALFTAGKAEVTFRILCVDDITSSITLLNDPTFRNLHTSYGILIRDWDNNGTFPVATLGSPDFPWAGPDGFSWTDPLTFELTYDNSDPSPMGGYSLSLFSSQASTNWYHGATGLDKETNFSDRIEELPTLDAEELYFNFYAKGNQDYGNTSMEFVYEDNNSTKYIWTSHVNWEGWRLISVKFSDFKAGTAPMETLDDAKYLAFQLGTQPIKSSEAQYNLDFVLITVGAPLFN